MLNPFIKFFDKLEDRVRETLSHRSIVYAFIGGACHVLFWRGVWHSADMLQEKGGFWAWLFYEPNTIIWTSLVLMVTGLFVASFIGDRIVISGIKKEKKITERTSEEVQKEEDKINQLDKKIDQLTVTLEKIKNDLAKK